MRHGLQRANAALSKIEDGVLKLAGISALAIMLIVSADVLMRYGLNRPFSWSYDLIGMYLVPLSFFFALSATFRRNHHVAVDLFYLRADETARRLARLVAAVLIMPLLGWVVALSAFDAHSRFVKGDAVSGAVLWPTWIPSFLVALGFLLLVIRLLLDAVALAVALASGSATVDGESPSRSAATVDTEDSL